MRYIMIGTIEEVHISLKTQSIRSQSANSKQSNVLFGQKRKLELAGGGFHKGKDMQSDKFQALMVKSLHHIQSLKLLTITGCLWC